MASTLSVENIKFVSTQKIASQTELKVKLLPGSSRHEALEELHLSPLRACDFLDRDQSLRTSRGDSDGSVSRTKDAKLGALPEALRNAGRPGCRGLGDPAGDNVRIARIANYDIGARACGQNGDSTRTPTNRSELCLRHADRA